MRPFPLRDVARLTAIRHALVRQPVCRAGIRHADRINHLRDVQRIKYTGFHIEYRATYALRDARRVFAALSHINGFGKRRRRCGPRGSGSHVSQEYCVRA